MTALYLCRLKTAVFVLLAMAVVSKENATELSKSLVVSRFHNGDEFSKQGECQSDWCSSQGGFCQRSCCICKCDFGETYFAEQKECLRDTSFLVDKGEGCKFQFDSCFKTVTLKTVDLRSSGNKMIKLCDKKVKMNNLFDCEVIRNSTRYYKMGKWQNLDQRTRTGNTFSLNIESKAKIKFKWEANTKLNGLLLMVAVKCQMSQLKRNGLKFDSCVLFKTAGTYRAAVSNTKDDIRGHSNTGASSGSTVAAIICSLLTVAILCVVLFFLLKRRKERNNKEQKQNNPENVANPSYERGEDTSIHFGPRQINRDHPSVKTNTEHNYQPLMNGGSTALAAKPHLYQSLERGHAEESNQSQSLSESQPEYASLEDYGPSRKKETTSTQYQQLNGSIKPKLNVEDDEEVSEYQEIPEYQDIDKSKIKDDFKLKDQNLRKSTSTRESVTHGKDNEHDGNYVDKNLRKPELSKNDSEPSYRVLEGAETGDEASAKTEHEYLVLVPEPSEAEVAI